MSFSERCGQQGVVMESYSAEEVLVEEQNRPGFRKCVRVTVVGCGFRLAAYPLWLKIGDIKAGATPGPDSTTLVALFPEMPQDQSTLELFYGSKRIGRMGTPFSVEDALVLP